MTTSAAVKALREHVGDSQQAFATRLGLSIRAVANYEAGRRPIARVLIALNRLARDNGAEALAELFWSAAHDELGLSPRAARILDDAHFEITKASLNLERFLFDGDENLTPGQRKALRQVKAGIARAQSMLANLDPFALSTEREESK